MKSRSLLIFVSLVMFLGLLGFQGQRANAAESFTAKWQSNPDGDKIDEGKSKTYNLSIENKGSSTITIKIETSSSGLEIYPKSQEVKGKGGFVAKVKVTMPKSNGAVKAYFSITVKSSKGDSKVFKFYIIYRQGCKWDYEWSKYPNGQTVKRNTVNVFKMTIKNTNTSGDIEFRLGVESTCLKVSDSHFTLGAGKSKTIELTTYTPTDRTEKSHVYRLNITDSCNNTTPVDWTMYFRD